jgi:hypothetical protein
MFAQMFRDSPLLLYPLVGLVIFIMIFAAAAIRAWRHPTQVLDARSRMPLDDGLPASDEGGAS